MTSRVSNCLFLVSAIALVVLFSPTVASADGVMNLPAGPVKATESWVGASGANSTVRTTLSEVPAGFDVTNGVYNGWCMEDNHRSNNPYGTSVMLLDSSDPESLPATYQGVPWSKVNYLLNHKAGTVAEVQAALWKLMGTDDSVNPTYPLTAPALAMVNDANTSGAGFVPAVGETVAVILQGDGLGPFGHQDTIIEVPRMSRANTYPTGKEPCEFIRDPDGLTSAPPLTLLYKTVRRQGPNGVVKTVEPNNFFYYSRIVGDGALKHLSIEQSNNFFGPSLNVHAVDIFTYTIEAEGPCFATKILGTRNTSFLISLADGVEYIIRVRYKPLGLKGYDLPESTPLGGFRYDFKTKLDGITVGVDAGGTLLKYLPN